MRAFFPLTIGILAAARSVAAQDTRPSRLARGDAQIAITSQNFRELKPSDTLDPQYDWLNAPIVNAAITLGWYWTDHQKTAIDFSGAAEGRQNRDRQTVSGSTITYSGSVLRIRETNFDVSQQYQFFHNAWVHPHVAAGIDIAREHRTEQYDPTTIFDKVTRTARTVGTPPSQSASRTVVRPFSGAGVKAYVTRRAFFSGDARLRFGHTVDEVRLRFGFGVDF